MRDSKIVLGMALGASSFMFGLSLGVWYVSHNLIRAQRPEPVIYWSRSPRIPRTGGLHR